MGPQHRSFRIFLVPNRVLHNDSFEGKSHQGNYCNFWVFFGFQEDLFDPHNELLLGLTNKEFNGYGIRANELFFAHSMYMVSKPEGKDLKRGCVGCTTCRCIECRCITVSCFHPPFSPSSCDVSDRIPMAHPDSDGFICSETESNRI